MILNPREVVGVTGVTGSGKSAWFRRFLKHIDRVFCFDPLKATDVNYLQLNDLLELHDAGAFKKGEMFRVGINHEENISVMGSISFVSGECMLAVEECAIAFENPRRSIESWLRELIFIGRHTVSSMIFVAQRPIDIPIGIRSQFTRLISFRQQEGADLQWLRTYFGNRIYEIPELQDLECLESYKGRTSKYKITYENAVQTDLDLDIDKKDDFSLKL